MLQYPSIWKHLRFLAGYEGFSFNLIARCFIPAMWFLQTRYRREIDLGRRQPDARPWRQPVEQKGVAREVYVYPVLTMADVKMEGVFVSEVNKPVYKKLQSTSSGKFIINLPAGVYSILIKEDAGLFVNSFDVKQQLNPITVNSGQVTRVEIIINYNAAY